jgi:hypothetical protein
MKKRPEETPDLGEASLPKGWQSLSYQSRRELMKGARIPPPGIGMIEFTQPPIIFDDEEERQLGEFSEGQRLLEKECELPHHVEIEPMISLVRTRLRAGQVEIEIARSIRTLYQKPADLIFFAIKAARLLERASRRKHRA